MQNVHKPYGLYEHFFKRPLDIFLSLSALIILSPFLVILIVIGTIAMKGNPFFVQKRPGRISQKTGQEKIFSLIKFRTMSNAKDKNGNLLPDKDRLNSYGRFLRSTSLDELPELINIVKGDMAIVGPRPQLVRDMVFMTFEQRVRHTVRPGLTGLAQVSGRNSITWETRLQRDLEYVETITFLNDVRIILKTVIKVLRREGISEEGLDTSKDYGDYLLDKGIVDRQDYEKGQREALALLNDLNVQQTVEV